MAAKMQREFQPSIFCSRQFHILFRSFQKLIIFNKQIQVCKAIFLCCKKFFDHKSASILILSLTMSFNGNFSKQVTKICQILEGG